VTIVVTTTATVAARAPAVAREPAAAQAPAVVLEPAVETVVALDPAVVLETVVALEPVAVRVAPTQLGMLAWPAPAWTPAAETVRRDRGSSRSTLGAHTPKSRPLDPSSGSRRRWNSSVLVSTAVSRRVFVSQRV
jgi:hypothetical protein